MTNREKMDIGQLYTDGGEGLPEERLKCRELMYEYNHAHPTEVEKKEEVLRKMLGSLGKEPFLEAPVSFAYGYRTHIGDYFYSNFNLIIVDDVEVFIGNHVMFAPNVTITTSGHPIDPDIRRTGAQFSLPVTIEDDVWIGAGVVILPGVTIGEGSVIGAGSVVTKNIPPRVVAVGTPCRVLRSIDCEEDSQ